VSELFGAGCLELLGFVEQRFSAGMSAESLARRTPDAKRPGLSSGLRVAGRAPASSFSQGPASRPVSVLERPGEEGVPYPPPGIVLSSPSPATCQVQGGSSRRPTLGSSRTLSAPPSSSTVKPFVRRPSWHIPRSRRVHPSWTVEPPRRPPSPLPKFSCDRSLPHKKPQHERLVAAILERD